MPIQLKSALCQGSAIQIRQDGTSAAQADLLQLKKQEALFPGLGAGLRDYSVKDYNISSSFFIFLTMPLSSSSAIIRLIFASERGMRLLLKKPFPERHIFYFLSAKFLFAFLVFCYDKKIAAFQLSARP